MDLYVLLNQVTDKQGHRNQNIQDTKLWSNI